MRASAAGRSATAERDAFAVVERMALRFSLADRVLISSPMWNFGVPYKLKQWFDLIVQPGLTFTFQSGRGLSRSGQGPADHRHPRQRQRLRDRDEPGPGRHGEPYLREILRFVGVRDTRFVLIGPTTGPQEPILAARERAHQRLGEMAATF